MDSPQRLLDAIVKNLVDLGAVSLEDYLKYQLAYDTHVDELHRACHADTLKFEFVEQPPHKQCILTITKPDGARRSYTTPPTFTDTAEAKSEAARIAIDMGALDFLASDAPPASVLSPAHVDDIERCCLDRRVVPRWVPFADPKLADKQGCALRILLSSHLSRVFVANPTFDTFSDAKIACANAAVSEGVLDFIKHGNGQSRPASPTPSTSPILALSTPWSLQEFYESLPRPLPEAFETDIASEINAPGWLNTMIQNARGGKLSLSFFFTSDGPPGLHGCLLRLDRPDEYRASLIDARFPKRSDAKAAVCLQAMSEGIGSYIRSISAAVDSRVTQTMRSFSNSLVYPALASELSKIETHLHPCFEYNKERDAFGATLVVKLTSSPTPEQVRRYAVPSDYRSKADARVGVICHAAELGVVEFARFRGGTPPNGYVSPYVLHAYNPDASRKRKQSGTADDTEQARPARKKRRKSRRREENLSSFFLHQSSDQKQGDVGPSRNISADDSCDPSQLPGTPRLAAYNHGALYDAQTYTSSYSAALETRFAGCDGIGGPAYGAHSLHDPYGGESCPPYVVGDPRLRGGSSRTRPGGSRRPVDPEELEPGEVVSSVESDFSESSSRQEDDPDTANNEPKKETVEDELAQANKDKGKGKEMVPTDASTTGGPSTTAGAISYVRKLIDHCTHHHSDPPAFYEKEHEGRFQVWIVIGKERFDLPATYGSAEEGRQRVAKQVLARISKGLTC